MIELIKSFSDRVRYRLASTTLIAVSLGSVTANAWLGGPDWVGLIIALPLMVLLMVPTHFRLQDAAPSPGWVVLMIVHISLGPSWELPGLTLYLSHLIAYIPVFIGWIAPHRRFLKNLRNNSAASASPMPE